MAIKMPQPTARPANTDQKAEAFISGAGTAKLAPVADENTGRAVVNMRFDADLLRRIDAAAKRQGISRTAWLHVAAAKALE
jgi:hypothetical protein